MPSRCKSSAESLAVIWLQLINYIKNSVQKFLYKIEYERWFNNDILIIKKNPLIFENL